MIDNPWAWIGTVWENHRKQALKDFKERLKRELSLGLTQTSSDQPSDDSDFDDAPNRFGKREYEQWARQQYAPPVSENSEEERLEAKKVKYESLSQEMRDLAGLYYLEEKTQAEIAKVLKKSQQAVSKKLRKLKAPQNTAPGTAGAR